MIKLVLLIFLEIDCIDFRCLLQLELLQSVGSWVCLLFGFGVPPFSLMVLKYELFLFLLTICLNHLYVLSLFWGVGTPSIVQGLRLALCLGHSWWCCQGLRNRGCLLQNICSACGALSPVYLSFYFHQIRRILLHCLSANFLFPVLLFLEVK